MRNDEINEQTPEATVTSQESTVTPEETIIPDAPTAQVKKPEVITQGQAPRIDATKIVDAPGKTPSGKIYGKTGEFLSNEEYDRRKEEDEAVMGYDQQIAALKAAAAAVNQETPEQKKKRERMEKSKKVIAATVDGLSALSNLFFTTQYAPNAYNPQSSHLGKVNERIEALKAERQADADRYNNYMLRLGDTQNAKAKTIRDIRAQHEAQRLARKKAEQEAEAHSWKALLQPDIQREQKGKADRAKQQAIAAEAEAQYAPQMQKAKLQTEKARAGAQQASATASRASAASSLASANATKQKMEQEKAEKPYAYDKHGNKHHFEKESTAEAFARSQGTWQEYEVRKKTSVTETGDKEGTRTTETVEKRGYSVKPKPKDNTPPSRRGNDDNVPPSRRKQ